MFYRGKFLKTIKYKIIKTYVIFILVTVGLILGGVYYSSDIAIKNITEINLLTRVDKFYKGLTIEQKTLEGEDLSTDKVREDMKGRLLSHVKEEEEAKDMIIRIKNPKGNYINHMDFISSGLKKAEDEVILIDSGSFHENEFWLKVKKWFNNEYEYMYINTTYNLLGEIYQIQFLMAMTEYEIYSRRLEWIYGSAITISVLLALIGGGGLSKKILGPLREINKTTQRITSKNLDERIPMVTEGDEFSELVRIINSMIERLEDSFDRQKRFISDASHELRTPLLIINGYAELLEEWGLEEKDVALEAVKDIRSEGENMKKIIEDLLFLAREDNGSIELQLEKICVKEVLNGLQKNYLVVEKEIEVFCEELYIVGDKKLFLQVLRALIENAFKFSDDKIILKGKRIGNEIRISVKDFGVGIDSEKIPLIFERFARLDDHRNRNKGGSGLGLSIVSGILKEHNWEIKVESEVDHGTTMIIVVKDGEEYA